MENRLRELVCGSTQAMQDIAEYVFNLGGKRIRPLLVLLCSNIYRANLKARVDVAAAAELIHTASLLHDDVVDEAPMRRGQPTVNRRWGNPSSVLAGDFLFARAFSVLSGYPQPLEVMTSAIATMSQGELIQLYTHFDPQLSPESYVSAIAGKTASLLAASCQCGGLISTMPARQVKALENFGMHLGIAYQVIDDIGDYILPHGQSGKTKGTDLKHGIITLPLMYLLANPLSRQRIFQLMDAKQPLDPQALAPELAETKALEKAGRVACAYIDRGLEQLKEFPMGPSTLMLKKLAIQLRQRCNQMLEHSSPPQSPGHPFQESRPEVGAGQNFPGSPCQDF